MPLENVDGRDRKASISQSGSCSRKMHPCGNALPLSSALRMPIHFPTDNSESVQVCALPESSHLILTLASSLLPQHSADFFIIACITLCLECQLFWWVFIIPAPHQGDPELLASRGHDSLILSPSSSQII